MVRIAEVPPDPPPVYVIHLAARSRFEPLRRQLERFGIPFELIDGVDGRDMSPEQLAQVYDEAGARRRIGRAMAGGEIGCALSHCIAYRRLLDSGRAMAVILEEDVTLDASFVALWRHAHALPAGVGVLSLFAGAGRVRRRPLAHLARFAIHRSVESPQSTAAYIVTASAAETLLRAATPIRSVADWPASARALRHHVVRPQPVEVDLAGSTIEAEREALRVRDRLGDPAARAGLARALRVLARLTLLTYLRHPERYDGIGNYWQREGAPRLHTASSSAVSVLRKYLPRRSMRPPKMLSRTLVADGAPAADRQVQCIGNWGDFDKALRDLTPGGHGVWDGVAFAQATAAPPDWTVVFNRADLDAIAPDMPDSRIVIAVGEPPTRHHRDLHLGIGRGGIVLTSDEGIVAAPPPGRDYLIAPPFLPSWSVDRTFDVLRAEPLPEKTRDLSWVTSALTLLPGHVRRLQFLDSLRERLAFDLFGRDFRPIVDKWDGLAPYRYSIAFENMLSPYYFTEKLMDCFIAGAMPIYCGSPIITDFFPAQAMVLIDPDDPDAVAQVIAAIRSDRREKNLDAIVEAKRLVLEEYNLFARLAAFVRSTEKRR